jgi:hypothetical protein
VGHLGGDPAGDARDGPRGGGQHGPGQYLPEAYVRGREDVEHRQEDDDECRQQADRCQRDFGDAGRREPQSENAQQAEGDDGGREHHGGVAEPGEHGRRFAVAVDGGEGAVGTPVQPQGPLQQERDGDDVTNRLCE